MLTTLPSRKKGQPNVGTRGKLVSEEPIPLYDLGALHAMAAGHDDFTRSLVKIFLATIPANSSEMVAACAEENWNMVSKLAHKLKSTVDMMRMKTITQEIRIIELDAKSNVNVDMLPTLVQKVDMVINAAAEQLREEFSF